MSLDDILQPHPEEDEALLLKINTMHAKIDTLSPAELLETDARSDSEAVKRNYYRLAKEFHPDRYFAIRDDSVKSKLTNIFDAITKAYNLLKDDASRAAYFRPATTGGTREAEEPPRAEDQFKRGIGEFKKGNYWGAADHFRWAAKLAPESGVYWNYLSLALSKIPGRLKDAEESLLTAIKLEPLNADFQANLGLIYLKAGMKKRAAGFFEKALRIDAANDKALKGLQQAEL
jgi:Flp pilus assembly protein TadD